MDESAKTRYSETPPEAQDEAPPDPSLPMYLIVLTGGIPGSMLKLMQGPTRIGRAPDNTLQLHDPGVSRYHAVLHSDEDGRVRITDLASTNGTYLNGRRVVNHTAAWLRDGDRIQFGSSVLLKFVRPDPCEERFQRDMFERTVRDALTGLYNRSFFLDQAGQLAETGASRGLGLAVMMVDVDHFKRINDQFGHDAGDAVLREVAIAIRQSTRSEDLVARYGGEEFVVALPIAEPAQALARAERIRRTLAGRRIEVAGRPVQVTASIGLVFAAADKPKPIDSLIASADLCLYKAKNGGRNCVMADQGHQGRPAEPKTRDDRDGSDRLPRLVLAACTPADL